MEGKQGADLNWKKEFTERHLENRKREIQKILFSKRIHPKEEKQKKIEHFFASEVPKIFKWFTTQKDIHLAEDEQEDEIKERGKLYLSQHFKKIRKSAGIADLIPTKKELPLSSVLLL